MEKDVIMYRAYVAQKRFGVVLDEINSASPDELLSVKMLADYLANESKRYGSLRTSSVVYARDILLKYHL